MRSERTFLDTIYFSYIFGKFFGLSCYSVSRRKTKYEVSFKISDFLHLIAYVGIFSILIYFNLQFELNDDENNTPIFNHAQRILLVLSLIYLIGGIFEDLFTRQNFWNVANTIDEVDKQVC